MFNLNPVHMAWYDACLTTDGCPAINGWIAHMGWACPNKILMVQLKKTPKHLSICELRMHQNLSKEMSKNKFTWGCMPLDPTRLGRATMVQLLNYLISTPPKHILMSLHTCACNWLFRFCTRVVHCALSHRIWKWWRTIKKESVNKQTNEGVRHYI